MFGCDGAGVLFVRSAPGLAELTCCANWMWCLGYRDWAWNEALSNPGVNAVKIDVVEAMVPF
jgi:hypothetical protein